MKTLSYTVKLTFPVTHTARILQISPVPRASFAPIYDSSVLSSYFDSEIREAGKTKSD